MITGGLFDLQVNGYAGVDFNDPSITPQQLDDALEAMRAGGVTGCLPTLITAHPVELTERFRALDAAVRASRLGMAMVPGYHLEGPFLNASPGYCGCHPPQAMTDPDLGLVRQLDSLLARPILLVTLAPERTGGVAAVRGLAEVGKAVAIGHSAAGFAEVRQAAVAGASLSTHLGNGLPAMLPKLENTLLAQLSEPRLTACLIADGHHMTPEALAAIVRLKGADHCILVSDAVLAAGADPGTYRFAGVDVVLGHDERVARPGEPGLAGSALKLEQAVRNVAAWQIAHAPACIEMAGARPRAAIGSALRHAGLKLDPGKIEWNSALEPRLVTAGSIAA
ncbi:MAG: hypothetical protein ABI478_06030 [Propionivibrio sp.]